MAFITGRDKPDPSNNVNHVAFRSAGTLDDLRALKKTLEADTQVTQIMPLTHGNAWSVYFRDPEFNGVEVFIDTPWHVRQPQGEPLDLDKSNDEIVEKTRSRFLEGARVRTDRRLLPSPGRAPRSALSSAVGGEVRVVVGEGR